MTTQLFKIGPRASKVVPCLYYGAVDFGTIPNILFYLWAVDFDIFTSSEFRRFYHHMTKKNRESLWYSSIFFHFYLFICDALSINILPNKTYLLRKSKTCECFFLIQKVTNLSTEINIFESFFLNSKQILFFEYLILTWNFSLSQDFTELICKTKHIYLHICIKNNLELSFFQESNWYPNSTGVV